MDDLRKILSKLSLADRDRLLKEERERKPPPVLAAIEAAKPVTLESLAAMEAKEDARAVRNYTQLHYDAGPHCHRPEIQARHGSGQ
jgi:hypothetical protein